MEFWFIAFRDGLFTITPVQRSDGYPPLTSVSFLCSPCPTLRTLTIPKNEVESGNAIGNCEIHGNVFYCSELRRDLDSRVR